MKRKLLALIMVAAMFTAIAGGFIITPMKAWAETPITLVVQGKTVITDVPPVIEDGRTLVPLRALMEAFTAQLENGSIVPVFVVLWDSDTNMVTITSWFTDSELLEFTIDSRNATRYHGMNEEIVQMDVPARIINSRTMIPARFVSEQLGFKVDWDANTQTIYISD